MRDDQWQRIENLLPCRSDTVGVTAKDNRLFVEAVLYRYRSGIPWRDLPERFGGWKNTYNRFNRWSKKNVWKKLFKQLANDPDNEYAMIDSTIVRAHQHSSCEKKNNGPQQIGRSKGGLLTKIHALTDALGNPIDFILSAGNVHDLVGADILLKNLKAGKLLADRLMIQTKEL